MRMACALKILQMFSLCMQDKATIERAGIGRPDPVSVGFAVTVHVVGV